MDTNNLIKSVLEENIVETKKQLNDILMQKLSERLQAKFDEFAPHTFLDEEPEETEESVQNEEDLNEEDLEANDRRNEVANLLEKKHKKEEDEDEEGEDDEEEMGEDGLVYEDGEEDCDDCNHENKAPQMNKKAFNVHEEVKKSKKPVGKQKNLDVAKPYGKLTGADFKKLGKSRKK